MLSRNMPPAVNIMPVQHSNNQQQQQQNNINNMPTIKQQQWSWQSSLDKYPAVQNIRTNFKDNYLNNCRSIYEFFDRTRVSRPASMGDAVQRINHNLLFFKFNYMLIACLVMVYALITNISLLVVVAGVGGVVVWTTMAGDVGGGQVSLAGGRWKLSQRHMYALTGVVSVPLLWLCGAGSTVFWVAMLSTCIVVLHAAMLEKGVETDFA